MIMMNKQKALDYLAYAVISVLGVAGIAVVLSLPWGVPESRPVFALIGCFSAFLWAMIRLIDIRFRS